MYILYMCRHRQTDGSKDVYRGRTEGEGEDDEK